MVSQMKSLGENITDQRVVEKNLVNFTGKYDILVIVIEQFKRFSNLVTQ